jgi:hypothetical protein
VGSFFDFGPLQRCSPAVSFFYVIAFHLPYTRYFAAAKPSPKPALKKEASSSGANCVKCEAKLKVGVFYCFPFFFLFFLLISSPSADWK